MEPFVVSARKYRPKSFKDVVGQQVITNTLLNAINNNHLAQALLFTGPRGVGKTTCARILAKMINSDNNPHDDQDFAFNIFELDAASNNSVDDIRSLTDQVRIPPQIGKYKVYIIDEVHMLSQAAFNAFLKTLEEPPKHCIFILATTEKHKIIPTILSRCQIFDFKRITVLDVKKYLHFIAKEQGVTAEDDALHIIAQKADGAMRDALSIFDRVVSFSGKKLTRKAVTENLNVLDYETYFESTNLILENKIPQLLLQFNHTLSKGFDGHHFITGLASHFRDLLVCRIPDTIELLEVGEQIKKKYLEQSKRTSQEFLIDAISLANDCDLKYKSSKNQRLLVELCLMKLASINFDRKKKKTSFSIVPPNYFKEKGSVVLQDSKLKQKTQNYSDHPDLTNTANERQSKTEIEIELTNNSNINTLQRKELPSINLNANQHRNSGLSLSSIKKKKELLKIINDNKPDEVEKPKNSFTEEQFHQVWSQFTKRVDGEGKYNLLSHLTMAKPVLNGTTINLVYPNNTIKTEVERAQHDILSFIKDKLQNYDIALEIIVNETAEKKYAYTPIEKYDKLIEKNPLLDTLRKELGLEL